MRRVVLLIAAVLLASVGWSQTMTVSFNDGSTVKYDMNKVKSIDFTSDSYDNGNNNNNEGNKSLAELLVGTWVAVQEDIDYGFWEEIIEDLKKDPCSLLIWDEVKTEGVTQFRSDGTAWDAEYEDSKLHGESFSISKYKWSVINDSEFRMTNADGEHVGMSFTYLVHYIDNEKMILSVLGITATLRRVPDSCYDTFIEYYSKK